MGPRSFNRGNDETADRPYFSQTASMGPRSFNRGNHTPTPGIGCKAVCFNGAAVFQPRKSRSSPRFGLCWEVASMGPRSFNRGNGPPSSLMDCERICFNGAAVFQPRKYAMYGPAFIGETRLQWGRGLSTAEMIVSSGNKVRPWNASMGPRSFNRGNLPGGVAASLAGLASMGPRSFNRGNQQRAIEADPKNRLQWGRGLSTAEIRPLRAGNDATHAASMGPRSFNRGNLHRKQTLDAVEIGFNGAAVFQPRKWQGARPSAGSGDELQWGHGLSTAEIRP